MMNKDTLVLLDDIVEWAQAQDFTPCMLMLAVACFKMSEAVKKEQVWSFRKHAIDAINSLGCRCVKREGAEDFVTRLNAEIRRVSN